MVLIVCNTLYQLLVAINIKVNIHKNDKVDLILTDHTVKFKDIYINIKDKDVFNNVYYVETKRFESEFKPSRSDLLRIAISNSNEYNKHFNYIENTYNYLYTANINQYIKLLYGHLQKNNNKIIVREFEDGFSSYVKTWISLNRYERVLSKFGKKYLCNNIDELYLFEPNLYVCEKTRIIKQLPKISKDDKELVKIINEVFNYKTNYTIREKYIFLEESFSADKYETNDVELIKLVASIVGTDNFIVKMHPRNPINRFENDSIKTLHSSIPWEVFLLNNDFSDKVFITVSSNGTIMPKILFNEDTKTILLINLFKGGIPLFKEDFYKNYLENVYNQYADKNLHIPQNRNELMSLL